MATAQYFDNYSSTLASGYTSGGVSLVVTSATLLPSVGNFELTVDRGLASEEQFLCTARSGTTLTVVGAQGNTSASNHSAGATVDGAILGTTTMNQIRKDMVRSMSVATFDALASTEYRQGDIIKINDSPYEAFYNGSAWEYYYGSLKVVRPPSTSWSWDNQGTSTVTTSGGDLYFNLIKKLAVQCIAYYRTAPAAPYTVTALIAGDFSALQDVPGDSISYGLMFRDSSGKLIRFTIGYDAGGAIITQKWTTSSSGPSTYKNAGSGPTGVGIIFGKPIWLRIVDNNTNLIFYFSIDGKTWLQFDTRSRTDHFASGPTQIGIGGYINGSDVQLQLISWSVV